MTGVLIRRGRDTRNVCACREKRPNEDTERRQHQKEKPHQKSNLVIP